MLAGSEKIHPAATTETSVEFVAPEALTSEPVSRALRYWKDKRGAQRFPSRTQITPRDMMAFLRNIVLVRVLDGGADYEYRIAGDAHVQAFGTDFKGLRLTELEAVEPEYGRATRITYEHVRVLGEPFALRGWVAPTAKSAFSYHETVFMPLGTDNQVDHLLIATVFTPRSEIVNAAQEKRSPRSTLPPGWKIPRHK